MKERPSLQTEVRGVSEKVKLLEDILVAYVKAHGGLIKYLTEERNRSRLLSAVKNGKATEILKGAFREVDRAAARHRAMLARMHEINDGEAVLPEFHPTAVVLPSYPEIGHHRQAVKEKLAAEKSQVTTVVNVPSAESKLPEIAEETIKSILELKKAEIRVSSDEKPVESAGKHPLDAGNRPLETKNDPDLAKKEGLKRTQELFAEGICPTAAREMRVEKGDSASVRAFKESMIGKEP